MPKYLKYKLVDNDSGEFLGDGVMGQNGLRHPIVTQLDVKFTDANNFFYATAHGAAAIPEVGNITQLTLEQFEAAANTIFQVEKASHLTFLWAKASSVREAATVGYHSTELMAGSTYKIAEATLALAANSEPNAANAAPLLAAEASIRGWTTQNLASRIVANYTALTTLEAQTAGYTGALADVIYSAEFTGDLVESRSDLKDAMGAVDVAEWFTGRI